MFPHKSHYFLKDISKVKNKMRLWETLRDWSYYTWEGGWLSNLPKVSQTVCGMIGIWNFNILIWFPKPIYLFQRSETVFREASNFFDTILKFSNKTILVHWVFAPDYSVLSVKEGSPIRTVIIKTPLISNLTNGIWVLMTVGISVPAFSGIGVQSSI